MCMTSCHHLWCVSIKYCLVVCLVIICKDLVEVLVWLVSVHLECFLSHLDTTIRHKCSLKWLVCLKTYDLLKILCLWINVTRTICCNAGYNICVLLQYTTVVSLCLLKSLKLIPELVRSVCWSCKEALVSIIRCVVVLDEVSYVALFLPESTCE